MSEEFIYPLNDDRYCGWDAEAEADDRKLMIESSEACGRPWHRDWDNELKDAVYKLANNAPAYIKEPYTWANYNYVQNATNGCAAINCVRALACLQEMQIRRGKKTEATRYFEGWPYAVYHAAVKKDYSYGGCTISGICTAINKYGILPYAKFSEQIISDGDMGKLKWNTKRGFQEAYEKHGSEAEQFQVVTTEPDTFEDFLAILHAGYPIVIGTQLRMTLNRKTGYYEPGGRTNHAMCALPPDEKDYRWGNSYGDNIANVTKDTLARQFPIMKKNYGLLALLDIEK